MTTALVIGGAFVAAIVGGLVVAWLTQPLPTPPTKPERVQAWGQSMLWASLHYGGTANHPGPEAFPRVRVHWSMMADGSLYAPILRFEGKPMEPSRELCLGLHTEPEGTPTMFIRDGLTFSDEVLRGGASNVWLSDVRVTPPLP